MCYRCEFCNVVVPAGQPRKTVTTYKSTLRADGGGYRADIAGEYLSCGTCKAEVEAGTTPTRPWANPIRFSKKLQTVLPKVGRHSMSPSRIPNGVHQQERVFVESNTEPDPVPTPKPSLLQAVQPQPVTLGGVKLEPKKPKPAKFIRMQNR